MKDPQTATADASSGPQHSLADELAHLAELHAAGELSDEEYQEAKLDEFAVVHASDAAASASGQRAGPTTLTKDAAVALADELNAAHSLEVHADDDILADERIHSYLDFKLADSHGEPGHVVGLRGEDGAFVVVKPSVDEPWRTEAVRVRSRKRTAAIALIVVAVVITGVVSGLAIADRRAAAATRNSYLKALSAKGVRGQFPNDAAAVANAHRVCNSLANGGSAEGYARDAIGVKSYCSRYYAKYAVVPTPEEQRAAYLSALRDQGLAGKFASDENAVAHAQKVCADLKAGGAQQGMPEDKVAVQAYCPGFVSGFKVLRTVDIPGTFTLVDSNPSVYFPAIEAFGSACQGSGGYSDITPGTAVTVKNGSGTLLAQSALGPGVGTTTFCTFSFSVTLTEGESQYIVDVSHRGSLTFTFTELDVGGIHLSLGS